MSSSLYFVTRSSNSLINAILLNVSLVVFMGLIFWIYIFVILIKRIKFNFVHTSKFYLILIFLNTIVIWDFFLSPYGGTRMIEFPLYLAILFFLNKNKELQND